MDIFPITLRCDREKGWSNHDFRALFITNKPDGLSWYGYDVVINSSTDIKFIIWDMYDNFYGGCGNIVAEFNLKVNSVVTRKYVVAKVSELALLKVRQDKEYDEAVKAAYIAEELLNGLGE